MTEYEAKTKWCPFVRTLIAESRDPNGAPNIIHPQGAMNRVGVVGEDGSLAPRSSLCIGSECMAWRWIKKPKAAQPLGKPGKPGKGYCGLAGRP